MTGIDLFRSFQCATAYTL